MQASSSHGGPSFQVMTADYRRKFAHWRRINVGRAGEIVVTRERFRSSDQLNQLGPLQSLRALRLHRPLRRRHVVHRLCARPACARTDAQQRPRRKVHRGPAAGAAGISGSVPVCGKGAGTRVRGEATHSRAEGRVGRQREATPQLNQRFQKQPVRRVVAALVPHTFAGQSTRQCGVFQRLEDSVRIGAVGTLTRAGFG